MLLIHFSLILSYRWEIWFRKLFVRFERFENMRKVIEAVYEKGVFKPLQSVELEEGAKVLIEIKEGIADILEKFSRKVNKEFLEERR